MRHDPEAHAGTACAKSLRPLNESGERLNRWRRGGHVFSDEWIGQQLEQRRGVRIGHLADEREIA